MIQILQGASSGLVLVVKSDSNLEVMLIKTREGLTVLELIL